MAAVASLWAYLILLYAFCVTRMSGQLTYEYSASTPQGTLNGGLLWAATSTGNREGGSASGSSLFIDVTSTYRYFALQLYLRFTSWPFLAKYRSYMRLTIRGANLATTVAIDSSNSLILSFAVGNDQDAAQYFSVMINLSPIATGDAHTIGPQCTGGGFARGNIHDIVDADLPETALNERKERTLANADTFGSAQRGVAWPIVLEIDNDDLSGVTTVRHVQSAYTQSCSFTEALFVNENSNIYINGDDAGEQFRIDGIQVETWYDDIYPDCLSITGLAADSEGTEYNGRWTRQGFHTLGYAYYRRDGVNRQLCYDNFFNVANSGGATSANWCMTSEMSASACDCQYNDRWAECEMNGGAEILLCDNQWNVYVSDASQYVPDTSVTIEECAATATPTSSPTRGLVRVDFLYQEQIQSAPFEHVEYAPTNAIANYLDETAYDIGWVAFNSDKTASESESYASLNPVYRTDEFRVKDGTLTWNESTNWPNVVIQLVSTLGQSNQEWHGQFARRMNGATDRRFNTLHFLRNFMCATDQSRVTIRYDIWFCQGDRDNNNWYFEEEMSLIGTGIVDKSSRHYLVADNNVGLPSLADNAGNAPIQPPTSNPGSSPYQPYWECEAGDDVKIYSTSTTFPTPAPNQHRVQIGMHHRLSHNRYWFLITNFELECAPPTKAPTKDPTRSPTRAPSQPPTGAPTQPPTQSPTGAPTLPPTRAPTQPPTRAPTNAPTSSPLTCPDYRSPENSHLYQPIDGLDEVLDLPLLIDASRVHFNGLQQKFTTSIIAERLSTLMHCNDENGCEFSCVTTAGCMLSTIDCRSRFGCSLVCDQNFGCARSVFKSTSDAAFQQPSTSPTMSPAHLPTSPTRSPVSGAPPLEDIDVEPTSILGLCQGDCDNDGDCESGLGCIQRSGTAPVPGCSGTPFLDWDYCLPLLENIDLDPTSILGLCQGDCDNDGECASGLVCVQRSGSDPVPECGGTPTLGWDYCVLSSPTSSPISAGTPPASPPATNSSTLRPTTSPTPSPTDFPTSSPTIAPTSAPSFSPTVAPTFSPTQMQMRSTKIHIECGADACKNMVVSVSDVSSAHIHCHGEDACLEMVANFNRISMYNNTDSSISCYDADACNGLRIYADGELTRLNMYGYSSDIVLDNGYGWSFDDDTITCDLHTKYVQYEFDSNNTIEQLVRHEYPESDGRLPCEGIEVRCLDPATGLNASCTMRYLFATNTQLNSLGAEYPKHGDTHCVYLLLDDVVNVQCEGSCQGSPTGPPTSSPTGAPTQPPTAAPTNAPTFTPTGSPSQPPTAAPSFSPSAAPTLSPTFSPSAAPTFSPSAAPSSAPTLSPSNAPTFSPTQAPTRAPHMSHHLYTWHSYLTYRVINVSASDCETVHNFSTTGAVAKMEEMIEQGYFHTSLLPEYELFQVVIVRINKVELDNANQWSQLDLCSLIGASHSPELHLRTRIDHIQEYNKYILARSIEAEFESHVTELYRAFFDNAYLNFSFTNESSIELKIDEPPAPFDLVFYALNGMLAFCILLGIFARIHNGCGDRFKLLYPTDNSNWLAVIIFGIQIYDVVSDINLTTEIFTVMGTRECDPTKDLEDQTCVNDGDNDDRGKWDTIQEYALLAAGVMSVFFLVIPYLFNIAFASRVPNSKLVLKNTTARGWFEQYQSLFITLVVFSGGCYPALTLVSSNIFGIPILNCGLSSFEIAAVSDIRLITTVISENVPQLFVQLLFTYAIGKVTVTTGLAFATSIVSVLSSILNYFINRDKAGQTHDVFYFFELKLKNQRDILSKPQKKHIKRQRGMRAVLAKQVVDTYGDIDEKNFEIGFVTLRKNNFVIRVCQHIHENEVTDKMTVDELDRIEDPIKREEAALKPFQNHCQNLYFAHRGEIQRIVMQHFSELDEDAFEFKYHKDYPKENTFSKVLHSNRNLRELISQNDGDTFDEMPELMDGDEDAEFAGFGGGADSLDIGFLAAAASVSVAPETAATHREDMKQFEADLDIDNFKAAPTTGFFASRAAKSTVRATKRQKSGGQVRALHDHRKQFRRGIAIITEEIERMKKKAQTQYLVVNTTQIQAFISILKQKRINQHVIEDVLHFATETGLILTEAPADMDEEQSVEYDSDGNLVFDEREKKRIRTKKIMSELQPIPIWARRRAEEEQKVEKESNKKKTSKKKTSKKKNDKTVELRRKDSFETPVAFPSWFRNADIGKPDSKTKTKDKRRGKQLKDKTQRMLSNSQRRKKLSNVPSLSAQRGEDEDDDDEENEAVLNDYWSGRL